MSKSEGKLRAIKERAEDFASFPMLETLLGRLDRINRDTKTMPLLSRECAELMGIIRKYRDQVEDVKFLLDEIYKYEKAIWVGKKIPIECFCLSDYVCGNCETKSEIDKILEEE